MNGSKLSVNCYVLNAAEVLAELEYVVRLNTNRLLGERLSGINFRANYSHLFIITHA